MRFAIIENGVVSNVVLADEALESNWVETDQAGPGWLYDGSTFSPPPPVAPTKSARVAELKQRLADTDYVALSDYDKSKPEVLAQRQAWREEIRTLEAN
jgi:hypothetical protein